VADDRRNLSGAERRARRERIQRRSAWARSTQTDRVLTVAAHGRSIHLYDAEGKVPACWRAGVPYEQALLERIHSERFTGVAVDVGANIGNHTLWLAGVCDLQVVAFEPIKQADLIRNVELNKLGDRVTIHPVALGLIDGQRALHVGRGRLVTGKGVLPVRDLDGFGLAPSVIKIDVEGMETQVLAGAEHTIRDHRPVIFAEVWGEPQRHAIDRQLIPFGYRLTDEIPVGPSTTMGRWAC